VTALPRDPRNGGRRHASNILYCRVQRAPLRGVPLIFGAVVFTVMPPTEHCRRRCAAVGLGGTAESCATIAPVAGIEVVLGDNTDEHVDAIVTVAN
jgi:hypothetical protein